MPHDAPIAHTTDGRPIYDNTPTVVAVVAFVDGKWLAIRRANSPGKGLIGLPGGYHMRGETWQQAGAREVLEETGFIIDTDLLALRSMVTDEYGNNLVIARYNGEPVRNRGPVVDPETEEVLLLEELGKLSEWAFPRHYAAALKEFL